jgi:hypothetical protein
MIKFNKLFENFIAIQLLAIDRTDIGLLTSSPLG